MTHLIKKLRRYSTIFLLSVSPAQMSIVIWEKDLSNRLLG
ncbi:hypothetical protein Mmol_2275 [Methylotenera mobilis JLW8]|uniref:Uncharacterized protein n=1 Tax=Methylotenera mobilis (strain JLW8 / ATCC BAA-1282 / DSM 17540) TaxID=583345 RepID=C6WTN6_METML|nr:hypothetical protein Mmol_2275 [Methylotenera mobilis JLW8]